jgi:hypothetical protein
MHTLAVETAQKNMRRKHAHKALEGEVRTSLTGKRG